MDYIVIIPFAHTEDVDRFAREHNVKKYTGMYLPARGINCPKKFLIVIEEVEEQLIFSTIGGYYFKDLNSLNSFRRIAFKNKVSIYWKLTNGDYILFDANIKEPLGIHRI